MPIQSSEEERIIEILVSRGLERADFVIEEYIRPASHQGMIPERREIHIFRKSTRTGKSYNGRYQSIWLAEFDDDLSSGYFDCSNV